MTPHLLERRCPCDTLDHVVVDIFAMYERLWRRAQSEGAFVFYFDQPRADPPSLICDQTGAAGYFMPNADADHGSPVIGLYRLGLSEDAFAPGRRRGPEGAGHPDPDLEWELITLAHEYGHLQSYRGRTPRPEWEKYNLIVERRGALITAALEVALEDAGPHGLTHNERRARIRAALVEGLDDDARARVMHEESLAWQIGREILAELGFAELAAFEARASSGLREHRIMLGIEPDVDDDAHGVTE